MARSIAANRKKRGRGRPPTGIGPVEPLRLYPEMDEQVRSFMRNEPDNPTRAEALRRLVDLGLKLKRERESGTGHGDGTGKRREADA